MNTGIFIDDTASASQITDSKYLKEDRRTWVSVFFSPDEREEANNQLRECIELIKEEFDVDEFHFTDIYSGTKKFHGIDIDKRLALFQAFVAIYNLNRWKIIVQTVSNRTTLEHGIKMQSVKVEGFDLSNNNDFALFLLLLKCKEILESEKIKYSAPADFIVDAGRQKANTVQRLSFLSGFASDSVIRYRASNDDILIQLADFIAFSINRTQMILVKKEKSKVDNRFLEIMSDIDFNAIGLENIYLPKDKINTCEYDNIVRNDKDKKGLISDAKFDEYEKILNSISLSEVQCH